MVKTTADTIILSGNKNQVLQQLTQYVSSNDAEIFLEHIDEYRPLLDAYFTIGSSNDYMPLGNLTGVAARAKRRGSLSLLNDGASWFSKKSITTNKIQTKSRRQINRKPNAAFLTRHYYIRLSKAALALIALSLGIAICFIPNLWIKNTMSVIKEIVEVVNQELFPGKTFFRFKDDCQRCLLSIALKSTEKALPLYADLQNLLCNKKYQLCGLPECKYEEYIKQLTDSHIVNLKKSRYYLIW